jgi:hypothetical protein
MTTAMWIGFLMILIPQIVGIDGLFFTHLGKTSVVAASAQSAFAAVYIALAWWLLLS